MIAILWNRETTIYAATEGKAGQHNYVITSICAILVVLIFMFGTAGSALVMSPNHCSTRSIDVRNAMLYLYYTFFTLTVVTVIVPAVLLQRASCVEGVVDKVCIPCMWFSSIRF